MHARTHCRPAPGARASVSRRRRSRLERRPAEAVEKAVVDHRPGALGGLLGGLEDGQHAATPRLAIAVVPTRKVSLFQR